MWCQHRQFHHQAQPCNAQPNGTSWCCKITRKNSERHNPTTEHAGKKKLLRILSMKISVRLGFVLWQYFPFFYAFRALPLKVSWGIVDLNIKHRSIWSGENLTSRCRTKIKNYMNKTLNRVIKWEFNRIYGSLNKNSVIVRLLGVLYLKADGKRFTFNSLCLSVMHYNLHWENDFIFLPQPSSHLGFCNCFPWTALSHMHKTYFSVEYTSYCLFKSNGLTSPCTTTAKVKASCHKLTTELVSRFFNCWRQYLLSENWLIVGNLYFPLSCKQLWGCVASWTD
jgi:hypothetical protein